MTKLKYLKSHINALESETVKIFDKNSVEITDNDVVVGTGMTAQIFQGTTVMNTNTIVIYGDVSGDGLIDLDDLVSVRNDILESDQLDGVFKTAGDLYSEGNITLNDLVGLMASISESGIISQPIKVNW